MKNKFWLLLFGILALASCSDDWLLGKVARKDTLGKDPHHESSGLDTDAPDTTLYICAVEFPQGYDWQRDTAYGSVQSNLVVFRNSTRIITVPVGSHNLVSADPDMHRVVDGHLYTDYVLDNHTIVKKDGKEAFRYSGGESLCGFLVRNNEIWTLGQARSGQGLSLRKNGKEVFSSATGIINGTFANQAFPSGALYEDSGKLCFAYYEPSMNIITGQVASKTWHVVIDGESQTVNLPSNISSIYDLRVIGGKICMAAEGSKGSSKPILVEGEMQYEIGDRLARKAIRNCRLAVSAHGPCVKQEESYDDGKTYTSSVLLLKDGNKYNTFPPYVAKEFYLSGDNQAYAGVSPTDGSVHIINIGLQQYQISGRMRLMTNACATFVGSRFIAAMSAYTPDTPPIIWSPTSESPIPLNGYVTSVSYSINE